MSKNILITGSAGFSGKHFINFIKNQKNLSVTGIDKQYVPGYTKYEMNLLNESELLSLLKKETPNYIIHLAGLTKADNPQDFYNINVLITLNLLNNVVNAKLNECRILLVSSSAVYGTAEGGILSEDCLIKPINFYGITKACMEQIGLFYARNYGLKVNIARPFNIIGLNQSIAFVIPSFAKQLLNIKHKNYKPVIKVGNLNSVRDFIDVEDVITAYLSILKSEESGQIYNIASGKGYKIEDILHDMIKLLKLNVKIEIDSNKLSQNDIPEQIGNINKISKLDWQPKIKIRESLKRILGV
jgi:GDP-4-dehydro-6-deoxy-D-mannose reductase